MEHKLVPYQAIQYIPCSHALVFAPHPDDKVFGCGGAIMRHIERGTSVSVIVVSDGAYGVTEEKISEYIAQHQNECNAAAQYAGAAGGFNDKYGYPFCRGRIFDTLEKDNHQYDDEKEIFWASGACFFIRKNVYRKLNGFDDDFFAHQEEIDLCWRAFNLGYKVKYTSKSVVYHVGGATLNEGNPEKTFLNFRNSLLMLTKNLPKNKLFPIIFTRLILDGLAGIQFIMKGKFKHCFAIIKAHFYFYHLISANLKRNPIQKKQ